MRLQPISDIKKLTEFHKNSGIDYEFNPGGQNVLVAGEVINDDGKIIGGGYIKLFAEAVISLDKDCTTTEKIWTIKILLANAIKAMDLSKIEELHVFTADDKFAGELEKLGFMPIPQRALVLEVPNGKE